MTAPKKPDVIFHEFFQECESDFEELLECLEIFLKGDCGCIRNEDEILGFMRKSVEGKLRHGVYETDSGGRIHVVGDDEKVMVMPDIVYAQATYGVECSLNTCNCPSTHNPNPTKQ